MEGAKARAFQSVIGGSLAVSGACILAMSLYLPMVSNQIDYYRLLHNQGLDACKSSARDIASSLTSAPSDLSLPGNRTKRQAGCQGCCLPGQPGPKGVPGSNGKPGMPGKPGLPGNPGRPPAICSEPVIPPCRPCPPGPPGPNGRPGPPGQPGQPGNAGRPGNDGRPGNPGPQGQAGPRGPPGNPGLPGQPGQPAFSSPNIPGDPGRPGNPGRQGPAGDPGADGRPGNNGAPGPKGPPGAPGLPGPQGQPGAPGQDGLPGQQGQRGQCEDCTIYAQPQPAPQQTWNPAPASYGDCGSNVAYEFQSQNIVTDVLDAGPECRLPVEYSPYIDRYAFGINAKYSDIMNQPTSVDITASSDPNAYHTLIMIDLDAPSRQDYSARSALHWAITNIRNGDWRTGSVVASYQGLQLQAGNNGHRVAYLVFRQDGGYITVNEQYWSLESRFRFDLRYFIRTYNLYYVPTQGNFYIINYN